MRMRPLSGARRRCSSDSVVVLPDPVGPTSATVCAGLGFEIDIEHALPAGGEAEADVVVAHFAARVRQRLGAGLLGDAVGLVDEREIGLQDRRLTMHGGDEAGDLIELGDQQIGKADERHDLADRQLAAPREHGAEREDGHHGDGGGGALQHRQDAPPGQHRILRGQEVAHDAAHGVALGFEAREALHHRDVADDVADAPVDRGVVALDVGLARLSSCA